MILSIDTELYKPILIGITREGQWKLYEGGLDQIAEDTWFMQKECTPAVISPDHNTKGILVMDGEKVRTIKLDGAFPVLHGKNGEDGTIQGLLDLAGIPVIGCGTLSSALCMHKDIAHKIVAVAGVRSPYSELFTKEMDLDEQKKKLKKFEYPLFVKPAKAGSSYGITRVEKEGELGKAMDLAFQYDDEVVLEENILGFEVGCSVLGKQDLIMGKVDEIQLETTFFDYKEKYFRETAQIYMPARISHEKAAEIKKAAAIVYKALGCSGFARVDLFLTPEGEIVFNEVNTIPGLTNCSRFPNMLKGAGYTFEEIVGYLIGEAVKS